jgi:putative aminopeptidase FrvX
MSPRNLPSTRAPSTGPAQIKLLEKLSNACAVSGDENEVRSIIMEEIKPYAQDIQMDALGNILALHQGAGTGQAGEIRPRVMLDAHMDEVGFMLVADDGDGLYRIEAVGGLDARQLAGKPVWVGRDHVPGVIGARPIHLTTADERRHTISIESMRIDVGPGGNKVKVGDRATFATSFTQLGPSLCGKALDNRIGVATLIELLKHAPENVDLLLAFTVQEEIGLRGAKVAAHALDPDLAIAVDSTPAYDLPTWDGVENTQYNTRLGGGPAIYLSDAGTLSDPRLVRWLAETAEKHRIPHQFRQPGGGGTNAGVIHKQRAGIPSVSISVPGRYAHTAALISRLSDWKNTLALLHHALRELPANLLER